VTADADVVIVGAGPAGATAARALALGGARVRLIDRHRFPRSKPCGGAITTRALNRFPHLRPALGEIATHYLSQLYLQGPSGAAVTLSSPTPAVLMIRRIEFDALLVRLAQEAGAELVDGVEISRATLGDCGVEVNSREGGRFRAPLVIAADGVNSVIARRLGFNRGWPAASVALDMMEEAPNDTLRATAPDTLWVSYGYDGSDGYGYVFPKRDHTNVGIGYVLSFFRERMKEHPYDLQRRFVAALRDRGAVEGESRREHFTPYLIPVGGPLSPTARGPVLLVGDAAGFVNAYTAEGIYYAMVSGDLAARAILEDRGVKEAAGRHRDGEKRRRRAGGSPATRYVSSWKREIGTELADSRLIQRFLFHDRGRIDRVVSRARAYPEIAALIVGYASGEVPYLEARRRVLAQFPKVGLRFAIVNLLGRLSGAPGH
jgi:geranylgeranyl reductase family protein